MRGLQVRQGADVVVFGNVIFFTDSLNINYFSLQWDWRISKLTMKLSQYLTLIGLCLNQ